MKIKPAAISLSVITLLYLIVLIVADVSDTAYSVLPAIATFLPLLMFLSFVSYVIRYFRWHWLLRRTGDNIQISYGFLAYIAGFAFTATPGKLGELVRIRYLKPLGLPQSRVISVFIFERMFDLIVVLVLASLAVSRFGMLIYVSVFVCFVLIAIVTLVKKSQWLAIIEAYSRFYHMRCISRVFRVLKLGVRGVLVWNNPKDISVALLTGFLSWALVSVIFILLLWRLGIDIPFTLAMAIYPLAMLAGAASMLPGGVGTTEISIIVMLTLSGVSIELSSVAAIGIRIVTLWFAMFCGFISILFLEYKYA